MNPQAKKLLETIKSRQEKIEQEKHNIDEEIKQVEKMMKKETVSYEDVAKYLFKDGSYFYGKRAGIDYASSSEGGEYLDPDNSPTKEQLESILALNKLCNVAKYLNGDWLPDWDDNTEFKFYLLYDHYKDRLSVEANTMIESSRVYFNSEELAYKAIDILGEEEIKKALTLNH